MIELTSSNVIPKTESDDFIQILRSIGFHTNREEDGRIIRLMWRIISTKHAVIAIVILGKGEGEVSRNYFSIFTSGRVRLYFICESRERFR